MADAVAQAQAGQPVNLGKRPQQNQVRLFPAPDQRNQVLGIFQELDVSLIDHNHHPRRRLIEQLAKLLPRGQRAGGIVRVAHENRLRPRRDSPAHGGQVVSEIARGHDDRVGPQQVRHQRIDQEAILRHHHVHARPQQGVPQKLQDFIGAVPQDEVGGVHRQFGRQFLFEVKGIAIGVKMPLPGRSFERRQRGRRRAERVLIRRHLDDAARGQTQLAGDLLNRASGLINRQVLERRV